MDSDREPLPFLIRKPKNRSPTLAFMSVYVLVVKDRMVFIGYYVFYGSLHFVEMTSTIVPLYLVGVANHEDNVAIFCTFTVP
jgi:hypothetical protein